MLLKLSTLSDIVQLYRFLAGMEAHCLLLSLVAAARLHAATVTGSMCGTLFRILEETRYTTAHMARRKLFAVAAHILCLLLHWYWYKCRCWLWYSAAS